MKKARKKILTDEMMAAIQDGHNSLGKDITDVYQKIAELTIHQSETISFVKDKFKQFAILAGNLSVFLLEVNSQKDKDKISNEELNLLDHVRGVVDRATVIQDKINEDILKKINKISKDTKELSVSNDELVELIMDVQDESRVLVYMAKSMKEPESSWYSSMLTNSVKLLNENQKDK